MSTMSYISVIERYHDYKIAIHELLSSMVSGIADHKILNSKAQQVEAMQLLGQIYPFVDLLYVLDKDGIQVSDNVGITSSHEYAYTGKGKNRSQRSYFASLNGSRQIVVTDPYLSGTNRDLCLSAAIKLTDPVTGEDCVLVLDIDLPSTLEFLMGDTSRKRFQPVFKAVYSAIAIGLFLVVAALLYTAFRDLVSMANPFAADGGGVDKDVSLQSFSVIIFLTLALAIFDLGKTTLEEEVLMHKDIFRHSSTRRTITRFMAAILIAVSIEALLLLFKAALGDTEKLLPAVFMMIAAVGLLIGLGLYVFLGAKAETLLSQNSLSQSRR